MIKCGETAAGSKLELDYKLELVQAKREGG